MALPPLYKYLDVRGAKLTLGNRTFKHAKPSDFNDTEDLTIQSIFPEEIETALKRASEGMLDVILNNLDATPTCAPPMREKMAAIQAALRADPGLAARMKAEIANGALDGVHDVAHAGAGGIHDQGSQRIHAGLARALRDDAQGLREDVVRLCRGPQRRRRAYRAQYGEGTRSFRSSNPSCTGRSDHRFMTTRLSSWPTNSLATRTRGTWPL